MKNLFGYDILIQSFLNGNITANQFEEQYLNKYLADQTLFNDELFLILDWLFAEVDYFSNDPKVFPDSHVTKERLLLSAKQTLEKLRALK